MKTAGHGKPTSNARHLDKLRVEFAAHVDIARFFGMGPELIRVPNQAHSMSAADENASDTLDGDDRSNQDDEADISPSSSRAAKVRKLNHDTPSAMLDARFVKMHVKLLAKRMEFHLTTSTRNLASASTMASIEIVSGSKRVSAVTKSPA